MNRFTTQLKNMLKLKYLFAAVVVAGLAFAGLQFTQDAEAQVTTISPVFLDSVWDTDFGADAGPSIQYSVRNKATNEVVLSGTFSGQGSFPERQFTPVSEGATYVVSLEAVGTTYETNWATQLGTQTVNWWRVAQTQASPNSAYERVGDIVRLAPIVDTPNLGSFEVFLSPSVGFAISAIGTPIDAPDNSGDGFVEVTSNLDTQAQIQSNTGNLYQFSISANEVSASYVAVAQNGTSYTITADNKAGYTKSFRYRVNGGNYQAGSAVTINPGDRIGFDVVYTPTNNAQVQVTADRASTHVLEGGGQTKTFNVTFANQITPTQTVKVASGGTTFQFTPQQINGYTASVYYYDSSSTRVDSSTVTLSPFDSIVFYVRYTQNPDPVTVQATSNLTTTATVTDGTTTKNLSISANGTKSTTFTAVSSGATYTIDEEDKTGYTASVTYAKNGGSSQVGRSVSLAEGDTVLFTITYTAVSSSATVQATSNIDTTATVSGGGETKNLTITANATVSTTVSPATGGTTYTFDPTFKTGNTSAVTYSKNGGSAQSGNSVTLSNGDTVLFSVVYTPISCQSTTATIQATSNESTRVEVVGTVLRIDPANTTSSLNVTPSSSGTTYSLTRVQDITGKTYTTAITKNGSPVSGSSVTLEPCDTALFTVTYSSDTQTANIQVRSNRTSMHTVAGNSQSKTYSVSANQLSNPQTFNVVAGGSGFTITPQTFDNTTRSVKVYKNGSNTAIESNQVTLVNGDTAIFEVTYADNPSATLQARANVPVTATVSGNGETKTLNITTPDQTVSTTINPASGGSTYTASFPSTVTYNGSTYTRSNIGYIKNNGSPVVATSVSVAPNDTVLFYADYAAQCAPATITMSSNRATTATLSSSAGQNNYNLATSTPQSTSVQPSSSGTTYTLSASAIDGYTRTISNNKTGTSQVLVGCGENISFTVNYSEVPPTEPTINLTADPTEVASGGNTTLTWTTTLMDQCRAADDWRDFNRGSKSLNGSEVVGPLTAASYLFSLECQPSGEAYLMKSSVNVTTVSGTPECRDGVDNDGDGKIDHPADPGCESPDDPTESPDPGDTPECSDGDDNDGDGDTDYPDDPGCESPDDPTENPNPGGGPQCSDNVDNDGDGKIDFGNDSSNDPGCVDGDDTSEEDATVTLSANPLTVVSGGSSTLTWSSTETDSCTASGAWSGSKETSGSISTGAIANQSQYILTCSGDGGAASDSVVVNISDFTMASANNIEMNGGASTSTPTTITVTPNGGFSGDVALSISDSNLLGVEFQFEKQTLTSGDYGSGSELVVVVPDGGTIPSGSYYIDVRGTSGGLARTTRVLLNASTIGDRDIEEF